MLLTFEVLSCRLQKNSLSSEHFHSSQAVLISHKVMLSKISMPKALQAAMNNSWEFNIEIGHLFPCQSTVKGELQNALAPNNESSRCFEMTLRASSISFILMNRDSEAAQTFRRSPHLRLGGSIGLSETRRGRCLVCIFCSIIKALPGFLEMHMHGCTRMYALRTGVCYNVCCKLAHTLVHKQTYTFTA